MTRDVREVVGPDGRSELEIERGRDLNGGGSHSLTHLLVVTLTHSPTLAFHEFRGSDSKCIKSRFLTLKME